MTDINDLLLDRARRKRTRAARLLGLPTAPAPPGDPLRPAPDPAPPNPDPPSPDPPPRPGRVPPGPRDSWWARPPGDFLHQIRRHR